MNDRLTATSPRPKLSVAALAALACLAGAVQAQSNPFTVRAGQELTYDSNFRRAPTGENVQNDLISSTSLGARIDQPFGRQRYIADLGVEANVFQDNSEFNNIGYDALLGLDWSALRDWAGTVRLTSNQSQARFEDFSETTLNTDTLVRQNALALTARYGLFSIWSIDATAGYRNQKLSEPQFDDRNFNLAYVSGGLSYRPTDLVRLGALVRVTNGEYPDVDESGSVGSDFDRIDYELVANARLTGLSTVDARIALTKEEHELVRSRDYDGVTGSIAWIYEPTGKSRFNLRLTRETGNRGGDVADSTTLATNNRLTTRVSGGWLWAATSKIAVGLDASYARDRYDIVAIETGLITLPDGSQVPAFTSSDDSGSGNTSSLELSASYAYTRSITFECSLARLTRSAELRGDDPDRLNYRAKVASCAARFALQ